MARATSAAARRCSSVQSSWRETKSAADFDGRDGTASPHLPRQGRGRRTKRAGWEAFSRCEAGSNCPPPLCLGARPLPFTGRQEWSAAIGPTRGLAFFEIGLLPIALPVIGWADAVNRRRPDDGSGGFFIKHHDRPLAFLRLLDGLPQQLAIGDDRLVGRAEMLLRAVLHRAHGLAGPLVVYVDVGSHARIRLVRLLVRIEAVVVAPVFVRDVV